MALKRSLMGEVDLTGLEKALLCAQCQQRPKSPQVLSCCSAILCESCLARCSALPCPACGKAPIACVQLPFVDSLIGLLPLLRRAAPSLAVCHAHRKSGIYFCNDCREYLCSDCIYEAVCEADGAHRGHAVDKLSSKLGDIKRDFEAKLRLLATTEQTVAEHAHALMAFAPTLLAAREDALLSLYDCFGQMQTKYETAISEEIQSLTAKRQKVEARLSTLQTLDEDAQLAIANCPLSAIAHVDDFCEHVRQASEKAMEGLDLPRRQIGNELVPPFSSAKIKFKRFRDAHEPVFASGLIELDGNEWQVKVFPHGNGEHRASMASLFIELVSGFERPTQVTYRVEVEAVSLLQPNIVHEFVAVPSIGQSWGWKKFHAISALRSSDYVDDAGALTLTFSVHPDSYHALWQWISAGNERRIERLKAARAKAHAKAMARAKPSG
jgi:tripartite motif-containing protein 37